MKPANTLVFQDSSAHRLSHTIFRQHRRAAFCSPSGYLIEIVHTTVLSVPPAISFCGPPQHCFPFLSSRPRIAQISQSSTHAHIEARLIASRLPSGFAKRDKQLACRTCGSRAFETPVRQETQHHKIFLRSTLRLRRRIAVFQNSPLSHHFSHPSPSHIC